jgi:hypothetical protein
MKLERGLLVGINHFLNRAKVHFIKFGGPEGKSGVGADTDLNMEKTLSKTNRERERNVRTPMMTFTD